MRLEKDEGIKYYVTKSLMFDLKLKTYFKVKFYMKLYFFAKVHVTVLFYLLFGGVSCKQHLKKQSALLFQALNLHFSKGPQTRSVRFFKKPLGV